MLLMLQTKRQREVGMWRYREEEGMGEEITLVSCGHQLLDFLSGTRQWMKQKKRHKYPLNGCSED